jgi:site-specific DNA recombinase
VEFAVEFDSPPISTTHTGSLVNFVTGWADALEKEKIRQRTMDGKRAAARGGILPVGTGAGLFGYDYEPRDRAKKRKQARTVNEAEAAIVRRMFGMALEGLGVNTIARTLNNEGIRGKTGKPWHPWTLKNALSNPAYTGMTRYGKEATKLLAGNKRERHNRPEEDVIYVVGFTPPIIDASTFERVQAHLQRPRQSGQAHRPYLLLGITRCAACGTGMVGQLVGGSIRYYRCRASTAQAAMPRTCETKYKRMDRLDERVWAAVSKAVSSPDFIYDRLSALQSAPAPTDDGAALRAKVKGLVAEERGLLDAIRKAPSAAEIISMDLEKVASQRKALERELKAMDASNGHHGGASVSNADVVAFCGTVKPYLKAMAVEKKRELLCLLGFEATVAEDGEVKASIAVPSAINPSHHCTNMGMTT